MRIAVTFSGCHRRGGVERIVLECANFLHRRGHETHVFASEWDEARLLPGVIRHHVSVRMSPSLWHIPLFGRRSRRDLASLNPPVDVLAAFGVHSPPGGVLWVQSVHKAWLQISRRQRGWKSRLKQRVNLFHTMILWYEKYYYGGRRYRKLVALTPDVKADLMRLYDVPAEDIELVPNGFSPEEFNTRSAAEQREPVRRDLGYGPEDQVVVFVANELERKGFGPLLRAAASLGDPRVHLLVVGRVTPGGYAAEIDNLGMTSRVRFTGPSSDVAKYYAAADVFALPTQYEAWGMVIIEAMACGLPALTSRLAGAAVAVREGKTGELLDNPADVSEVAAKLKSLLAGGYASRDETSASVEHYQWDRVLLKYEQLLLACARAPHVLSPRLESPVGSA